MNEKNAQTRQIKLLAICDDDWYNTPAQTDALVNDDPQFQLVGNTKSGREGIELAQKYAPDVALIDTNVHDVNAIECIRLVKEISPQSKIIMMTDAMDANYLKRAMQVGLRYVLGKPLDKDEFVNTIIHVLK